MINLINLLVLHRFYCPGCARVFRGHALKGLYSLNGVDGEQRLIKCSGCCYQKTFCVCLCRCHQLWKPSHRSIVLQRNSCGALGPEKICWKRMEAPHLGSPVTQAYELAQTLSGCRENQSSWVWIAEVALGFLSERGRRALVVRAASRVGLE